MSGRTLTSLNFTTRYVVAVILAGGICYLGTNKYQLLNLLVPRKSTVDEPLCWTKVGAFGRFLDRDSADKVISKFIEIKEDGSNYFTNESSPGLSKTSFRPACSGIME